MRAIRSKNTKPEILVRKYLFGKGYRYRLHSKSLPGRPDLVFPSRKKIVLVHGCFWHQHSDKQCPIAGVPASNRKYWGPKMKRNLARDQANLAALRKLGFNVHVVWECELRANPEKSFRKIKAFLGPAGSQHVRLLK
jgi:DNA mismatch endonuclease (patch repair protein)